MSVKKYSNPRPNIPTITQREVKIEARFACIACKERVSFRMHHIDGNRENNNPENLAFLCANCHGMVHEGKISAQDLRECKRKVREENDIPSRLAQELEYFQRSSKISASKDFVDLKLKYQAVLNDYGDKLIFYQCFIYLIPEFYIDDRGAQTRETVRTFLNINAEEEERIIAHLQKLNATSIVGSLVSLQNSADARIALDELITKGKLDLSKLLTMFAEI
ncbi:MAG: HNH endonuclease signature motif containing protein [Candidatus Zapsychrus exili]|nr:HNH endonuclease signature motif containing protein [Candidatus Zapsychrus exili]